MTAPRASVRLGAALALFLCVAGTARSETTETTQAFGQALYREKVDVPNPPILHGRHRYLRLQVGVSMLTIEDDEDSLAIKVEKGPCFAAQNIDAYAEIESPEALTRLINTKGLQLLRLCKLDVYALGAERQTLVDAAGDMALAVAHMRRRAIALAGDDKRCEHRPPPPKLRRGELPPIPPFSMIPELPTCGGGVLLYVE